MHADVGVTFERNDQNNSYIRVDVVGRSNERLDWFGKWPPDGLPRGAQFAAHTIAGNDNRGTIAGGQTLVPAIFLRCFRFLLTVAHIKLAPS